MIHAEAAISAIPTSHRKLEALAKARDRIITESISGATQRSLCDASAFPYTSLARR